MTELVLYHCEATRSFRVLWTLEELGLPYELRMLPFPPRAHDRSYLTVNPLGTVPALFVGATRLTESAAIAQYLAERAGSELAVSVGEPDHPLFLNWLHFGEATLTFPQALILRYGYLEPPSQRQPQIVEDYTRWFLRRLDGIAYALESRFWLSAERFTVADVSVGYALRLADIIGLSSRFPVVVRHYHERLVERPAYRRAQAAERRAAEEQGVGASPWMHAARDGG